MKKVAAILLFLTYCYAFVRYHWGKNVPYSEWLYVLNKAFSWTGFTLIGISILPHVWFEKRKLIRKQAGLIGYLLASIHLILVLLLISPKRYSFLYLTPEEWSWQGIATVLMAGIALTCFTITRIASLKLIKLNESQQKNWLKWGKLGFAIAMLHPLVMSVNKWFVSPWPYYMPPITLLAVISGIAFFYWRWKLKKKRV